MNKIEVVKEGNISGGVLYVLQNGSIKNVFIWGNKSFLPDMTEEKATQQAIEYAHRLKEEGLEKRETILTIE